MQNTHPMIIPAAGYGTRMHHLTQGNSKEIIEIGGRPALLFALLEALAAGIERVGIVLRKDKNDILRMVQGDPRLSPIRREMDIEFFYQSKPTGEAGAIQAAAAWLGNGPFVVHYPDNIIAEHPGTLARLIERQAITDTDLVLLTPMLDHAQAPPCGLRSVGSGLYQLIPDETPLEFPYGLRPTGIYIATNRFLATCQELLSRKNSVEVKDREVRGRMVDQGHLIHGVDLSAKVMDIGNPGGYLAGLHTIFNFD